MDIPLVEPPGPPCSGHDLGALPGRLARHGPAGIRHELALTHAGALARVILAFRPPSEVDRLLRAGRLERLTVATPATTAALRRRLAETRATGVAVSLEEQCVGACGVSAPILGSGRVGGGEHRDLGADPAAAGGAPPGTDAAGRSAGAALTTELRGQSAARAGR